MLPPIPGNDLPRKLDQIEKRDAELFLESLRRGRGPGRILRNTAKVKKGRNAASGLGLNAFVGSHEVKSPFFWASFYHDGRGAVTPKRPGGWLAFYPDPDNDPRLQGLKYGYPRFRSEIRSLRDVLDDESFEKDILSGRLVMTKRFKPWKGNPVFDRAAERYTRDREASKQLSDYTEAHLTGFLDSFMKKVRSTYGPTRIRAVLSSRVPKGRK